MKQRRINATLTIAALALTTFLILTTLPLASTAAPRSERQPLESLTALNSTEGTKSGAPLSVFSALLAESVVQSSDTTTRISASTFTQDLLSSVVQRSSSTISPESHHYPGLRNTDAFFFDEFDGTELDSLKWNTDIATSGVRWRSSTMENHHSNPGNWEIPPVSAPYGLTTVSEGMVSFSNWDVPSRVFPYVWMGPPSRSSPFPPAGDFILEFRMKYDTARLAGDGFQVLHWPDTTPTGNNPPIPSDGHILGIWQDTTSGLKITLRGSRTYLGRNDLSFHTYRLEYINHNYSLLVDGSLVLGPFPSDLRPNTIWIGNPVFVHWGTTTPQWTTFSLDYVRVTTYDKPPVVLVHGWAGFGPEFITCTDVPTHVYRGTSKFFSDLPQWLHDLGYTEIYEVNLTTGPTYTPRFEENAECLSRQLKWVTDNKGKAIIIAHSMGGLVSRAYMENENLYRGDVVRLITVGSPHAGINGEFLLKILLGLVAPEKVADYCDGDPGTCQLSTEQVLLFDLKHNSRAPDVLYDFIGGRKTPFPFGWLLRRFDGPNDGFIGLASATGKIYGTDLKVVNGSKFVSRYQTNETHCSIFVGHPHYFEGDAGETRSCIRYLLGGGGTGGSCVEATTAMVQAQAPAVAYSLDVRGHITNSQTVTHSLQVDADGASLFYLSWVTGTLGITLTNPVGTVIDPAYAAAHTDVVTYTTSPGSEMTPPFAAYAFTTTVPGLYTATITAGDVSITGTDYLLFAAMETTRTLSVALDSNHYQIGDTAVLTATLEGAADGITGATVRATFSHCDAITDTLTLTDQGDGTYRGTYAIPNAPGYLHLRVTAEGSDAGTQFSRQVDRLLTVASQAVQLTGTYTDRADDADGNWRYETLTVDVEVLGAGAGDFTFSADLVTGGDQFVAHVITQTALITGTQSVPLRFDGELIQDGGSDGPFTVTNLLISDLQNAGIPSVMADDVWTTDFYDHTQFGRITGDLDGNCIVNIVDIMLVASRWGTHIGDIRYDGLYDLDNSGNIDVADIMFVAAHWRERCE